MITTRLRRQGNTRNLLVEFSLSQLPPPLEQFYRSCKEEGVQVRRGNLGCSELNFYSILSSSSVEVRGVRLEDTPSSLRFVLSVLYVSSEAEEQDLELKPPAKRTLLLREGLDTKFYHEYEFQNTESELESVVFLCELASTIINCQGEEGVNFYDQKSEEIKGTPTDNLAEKFWKNVFYQIPGLGKEKCNAIAQRFPTYEALLEDYTNRKELKNLAVSRGVKEAKLGPVLANRIYRCLFTEDGGVGIAEE